MASSSATSTIQQQTGHECSSANEFSTEYNVRKQKQKELQTTLKFITKKIIFVPAII